VNRKQEIQAALASLQSVRNNHDVQQVARWLALLIEEARDALVVCGKDGHDAASSKVLTIQMLHDRLTQPSMVEMQAPYRAPKE